MRLKQNMTPEKIAEQDGILLNHVPTTTEFFCVACMRRRPDDMRVMVTIRNKYNRDLKQARCTKCRGERAAR